MGLYYKIGENL